MQKSFALSDGTKGTANALTIYPASAEKQGMKKEPVDIVDKILCEDIELLEKWIRELRAKIESRTQMTKDMMLLLVKDIDKLEGIDNKLSIWGAGYKASIDSQRSNVRQQIALLKHQARQAELEHWRDVSALEKELRILEQALAKAKRKKGMMDVG
jgi:hypothetical protein